MSERQEAFASLLEAYHKGRFDPDTGEVYTKQLDKHGRELLDPTPVAPPVGYKRQPSLAETIRQMVRNERLAAELADQGVETFEESEDFEIGDDYDPRSPWENDFDPPISEIAQEVERAREAPAPVAEPAPVPGGAPLTRSPEPASEPPQ